MVSYCSKESCSSRPEWHYIARSAPINLEDIGTVHFRLYAPEGSQRMWLMRADVKIEGPTIFIFLDEATEGWPFTLENDSDYTISFSQTVRIICSTPYAMLIWTSRRIKVAKNLVKPRNLRLRTPSPASPASITRGTIQLPGTSGLFCPSMALDGRSTSWKLVI